MGDSGIMKHRMEKRSLYQNVKKKLFLSVKLSMIFKEIISWFVVKTRQAVEMWGRGLLKIQEKYILVYT